MEYYSAVKKNSFESVLMRWVKLEPIIQSEVSQNDVHSCRLLFDDLQFTLIRGPNIPGPYAIVLFTASDFTSTTSHTHNWVLFLLFLHLFILSGIISPLISVAYCIPNDLGSSSSSVLLAYHTVHGIFKIRILKRFANPFSNGPRFVRTLHHDPSIMGGTSSVHFSSVAQSCPTLCNPMNCSTPGLSVHHQFLEFTQTHVHRVSDAIQPSHPLSSPSPPAPNLSQHQSLFQ